MTSVVHDRTVIAVTHRLASVAQADWVFVLERGRLAEQAPPARLLEAGARSWRSADARVNARRT